ncbi:MAG: nucleotide exchange factor GrpE [Rhodospirillum sp.]|nr:nucleotide exchange factor GrpE [Rhodospirillum sp.]MCF8492015.1 nucleotide exchange factor GrpE [Rhodospirillum sp.]MCF8502189.1 nucleotide exchange factor GrpE [Rhodospirillum sp.]
MTQQNDTHENQGPESEESSWEDTVPPAQDPLAEDFYGLEDLEARIAALEAENRKLKEDYLRALAEAQNAKRMADKRIEDNSRYAVSNFARAIVGVADNLTRALMAAPMEAGETNDIVKNLVVGVEMTAKELETALGQYQVRKVEAQDTAFDPNFHQAVQEVENTAVPMGTVVQVLQDGYVIHDRLLRPAMVIVSRGGPKREVKPAVESGPEGVDRTV